MKFQTINPARSGHCKQFFQQRDGQDIVLAPEGCFVSTPEGPKTQTCRYVSKYRT